MVSASWILGAVVCAAAGDADPQLLHFTAEWCGPCKMMAPAVERLKRDGYPIRSISVDQEPEVARRFGVRDIPCFILVQQGREANRAVGAMSYDQLAQLFGQNNPTTLRDASAGIESAQSVPPAIRGQSPERSAGRRLADALGSLPSLPTLPGLGRKGPADATGVETPTVGDATIAAPLVTMSNAEPAASTSPTNAALAATVRLKIEDESGHSYGTGTVVDVHGQEALVLTCGHIFRDSQGRGKIHVHLFAAPNVAPVSGTLVAYDLDRDLGLVSFHFEPAVRVASARVGSTAQRMARGDRVFSVGCDRGGEPSVLQGRIKDLNRYLGPENLVVEGTPVDGRSGGGLFAADGTLIGVCNAADPPAEEGIYRALTEIQRQLDLADLAFVYQARPATVNSALANGLPRQSAAGSLDDAEVIIVIKSRSAPQTPPQVVVMDHASPALMSELANHIGRQRGGMLPVAETRGASGQPPIVHPIAQRRQPAVPASTTSQREVIRGQMR